MPAALHCRYDVRLNIAADPCHRVGQSGQHIAADPVHRGCDARTESLHKRDLRIVQRGVHAVHRALQRAGDGRVHGFECAACVVNLICEVVPCGCTAVCTASNALQEVLEVGIVVRTGQRGHIGVAFRLCHARHSLVGVDEDVPQVTHRTCAVVHLHAELFKRLERDIFGGHTYQHGVEGGTCLCTLNAVIGEDAEGNSSILVIHAGCLNCTAGTLECLHQISCGRVRLVVRLDQYVQITLQIVNTHTHCTHGIRYLIRGSRKVGLRGLGQLEHRCQCLGAGRNVPACQSHITQRVSGFRSREAGGLACGTRCIVELLVVRTGRTGNGCCVRHGLIKRRIGFHRRRSEVLDGRCRSFQAARDEIGLDDRADQALCFARAALQRAIYLARNLNGEFVLFCYLGSPPAQFQPIPG